MKINPTMLTTYFKTMSTSHSTPINHAGGLTEQFPAKVDTITISQKGNYQSMVSGITKNIVGDLMDIDSPERIQELKEAVSSGTYSVSVDELADAMMERIAL